MNATADPSGAMAGLNRSAPTSSAMTVCSPVATSMRTSTECSEASGAGCCHDVTTKLPSRADVEVGVAQRCARPRREIGRSGDVAGQIQREQMRGGGAEIGVPVPDRIAGMQDRGDLGVLA